MDWLKKINRTDFLLIGIYYFLGIVFELPQDMAEQNFSLFSSEFFNNLLTRIFDYGIDIVIEIIIVFYIFNKFFFQQKYLLTILLAVVLLIIHSYIQAILLPHYYTYGIPKGLEHLFGAITNNVQSVTGVCLILIAKQFYESKNQMIELQKAQKENELKILQAQVDPHFLFNNLNILDILIHSDPKKASKFTQKLSSLYRYMIRHKDQDVVLLEEEIDFLNNYIFLLQQRFDDLFSFQIEIKSDQLLKYYIPPTSLQTLVENVIKHNKAMPNAPINTRLTINHNHLIVENNIVSKHKVEDSTGTGLDNLNKRIQLLTDNSLKIEKNSETFRVSIPLVQIDKKTAI